MCLGKRIFATLQQFFTFSTDQTQDCYSSRFRNAKSYYFVCKTNLSFYFCIPASKTAVDCYCVEASQTNRAQNLTNVLLGVWCHRVCVCVFAAIITPMKMFGGLQRRNIVGSQPSPFEANLHPQSDSNHPTESLDRS